MDVEPMDAGGASNSVTGGPAAMVDMSELYSPERVARSAKARGMTCGPSMDVTTCDADARPRGFSQAGMRKRAWDIIVRDDIFCYYVVLCARF